MRLSPQVCRDGHRENVFHFSHYFDRSEKAAEIKSNKMSFPMWLSLRTCEIISTHYHQLINCPKHSQAKLYPSEVVTLALLYALSGKGQRAFWRWLVRDYRPLFPNLPERTRLFRLFNSHRK